MTHDAHDHRAVLTDARAIAEALRHDVGSDELPILVSKAAHMLDRLADGVQYLDGEAIGAAESYAKLYKRLNLLGSYVDAYGEHHDDCDCMSPECACGFSQAYAAAIEAKPL